MARETVPAQPFQEFLAWRIQAHARRLGLNSTEHVGLGSAVATELGWTDSAGGRRVWNHRRGLKESRRSKTDTYFRDTVEEAFHYAGYRFADWYPEIAAAEDAPLEPEQFCWGCEEIVTPIDGQCPWSEEPGHIGAVE